MCRTVDGILTFFLYYMCAIDFICSLLIFCDIADAGTICESENDE